MDPPTVYLSEPVKPQKRIPWTVSRCNRLIRPLASRLAALEKVHTNPLIAGLRYEKTEIRLRPHNTISSSQQQTACSPWRQPKRRKIRTKYGSRSWNRKSQQSEQSSQCTDRLPPAPAPCETCENQEPGLIEPHSEFVLHWGEHEKAENSRQWISNKAVGAFYAVLDSTIDVAQDSPKDKSLFAMCLRRVPQHIEDEQAYRKRQDRDDKSDVQNETWSALFDFGCLNNQGWSPLRHAVQAQSLHLLSCAVERRLIEYDEYRRLNHMFLITGCSSIRGQIVCAWLRSFATVPMGSVHWHDWDQMNIFRKPSISDAGCRTLNTLIIQDVIPQQHLKSVLMWGLRTLTSSDKPLNEAAALCLLENLFLNLTRVHPQAVDRLCHKSSKARKQHQRLLRVHSEAHCDTYSDHGNQYPETSNHCFGLCSDLLVNYTSPAAAQESWNRIQDMRDAVTGVIRGASQGIMRAATSFEWVSFCRKTGQALPAALVLLADIVILVLRKESSDAERHEALADQRMLFITQLVADVKTGGTFDSSSFSDMARLIIYTAKIIEAEKPGLGLQLVKSMCEYFVLYGTSFAKLLALDTAMGFAREEPSQEHEKYARVIERRVGKHRPSVKAVNGRQFRSIRWDEGLCEWVNATPLPLPRRSPRKEKSSRPSIARTAATPPYRQESLPHLETNDAALVHDNEGDLSNECYFEPRLQAGKQDSSSPSRSSVQRLSLATPCPRSKRKVVDACLDENEEDELSLPQPGQRPLGDVTNVRWCGLKRLRSKR